MSPRGTDRPGVSGGLGGAGQGGGSARGRERVAESRLARGLCTAGSRPRPRPAPTCHRNRPAKGQRWPLPSFRVPSLTSGPSPGPPPVWLGKIRGKPTVLHFLGSAKSRTRQSD